MVFNASTLTESYATNPMKLLTPRSRGLSVWTYTSSFGGGLVAGDQTRFDLRIRRAARCFVGTQSATKIYRNPARQPCGHVTRAVLEEESFLAFMPAPLNRSRIRVIRNTRRFTWLRAPGWPGGLLYGGSRGARRALGFCPFFEPERGFCGNGGVPAPGWGLRGLR